VSGEEDLARLDPASRKPRYQQLADDLRTAITRGDFPASDGFPTEHELCARYSVSRFTVREALRALQSEGLISRKRGSGTIVQPATARGGALHQPLSNVGELLQYARDTRIDFTRLPDAAVPRKIAEQLPNAPTGRWTHFRGCRVSQSEGAPIAITDAFIHPELKAAAERVDIAGATIFRQLEQLAGLKITTVTQDIQAVPATAEIAQQLKIARRSPCLRILRCYIDTNGRLFEISASHHPGDRFAYAMHIDVDG
jgi:DNA-binding GntR family transcriptional regulator